MSELVQKDEGFGCGNDKDGGSNGVATIPGVGFGCGILWNTGVAKCGEGWGSGFDLSNGSDYFPTSCGFGSPHKKS